MTEILILCVEDEPDVRDALERDLTPFADVFAIEMAEDAEDALAVIEDYTARRAVLGLVLADHVLPGTSGVDLLVQLHDDPATASARKVLITGQASHGDTIRAINQAELDHYIAKPWTPDELHEVVRTQLTRFVADSVDDVLPYVGVLDGAALMDVVRDRLSDR